MSNLTSGFLNVKVMRLDTTASLKAISKEMVKKRANHTALLPGWGSINDDESNINEFLPSPASPGTPTITAASGQYSERLYARLYYWTPDRDAKRVMGKNADPRRVSKLRATDFVLARIDAKSVLVAVTSRNANDVEKTLAPVLQSTVMRVDQKARLHQDTSPLDLGSAEIFMWLLRRYDEDRQLTTTLELANVREITSRDPLSRGSNLSHGVDLSRRELLALITNDNIVFGPAKLVTFERVTDGLIDLELFVDGGFAVQTGESRYGATITPRSVIGTRAVDDLIFVIIPALRDAFAAEKKAWLSGGKKIFVDKCLKKLQMTPTHGTALPLQCRHCGKPV